ncbi:hypothetical protein HHL26_06930 [Sphingobium sp. TB-6]|uniref:hypothetical protein n=1 Tax=Sphingobium sp. TB-6 TaxID=2728850 RepID=UPI00146A25A7|nr:hypothetical protein [Sphingobium sp. TB-6]NML88801.1 hypothetical protein [Sphingobium sp. TB-6]
MANFDKRLSVLEAGYSDPQRVDAVFAGEADISAWLLSDSGDPADRGAVWDYILGAVDGRSKGLPSDMGGRHVEY